MDNLGIGIVVILLFMSWLLLKSIADDSKRIAKGIEVLTGLLRDEVEGTQRVRTGIDQLHSFVADRLLVDDDE